MPTLTINFTTAQTSRISDAFTTRLRLDQPATAADIKGFLTEVLRDVVRVEERSAAITANDAANVTLDIT